MVGLVVASHGRLAEELVATAEQIVGKLPAVATCNIEPGTSVEDLRAEDEAGGGHASMTGKVSSSWPTSSEVLLVRSR